ncbi:mitotic spindle assembly checkpoint protein MAD2A-like [Glandiceps talaboti]
MGSPRTGDSPPAAHCRLKSKSKFAVNLLPEAQRISAVFDLLIYTDKDADVPEKWTESGAQLIPQAQEVKLRSFTTTIHKVDAMVTYKSDQ